MKSIDTHAHLNFTDFAKDYREVIAVCRAQGISVINVGTNYLTSKRAVEVAESETGVFAAIGLHALNIGYSQTENKTCEHTATTVLEKPEDFLECDFDSGLYKKLAESKKVVAIGEVGLDYYYKPKTNKKFSEFRQKQLAILKKQTDLACDLDLPVIFHVRMAHEDLIAFLREELKTGNRIRGVIHCFTGTVEQAKTYLDFGFYIGLNGIIFKMDLVEVIAALPDNRILFETDCPYLTPPQTSGRNEPVNMKYVIERVTAVRKTGFDKIAKTACDNAMEFFKIPL